MKKILFKSILLSGIALLTACNDGMTDFLNDYKTILYFTNSGEKATTIYRTGEENICPVIVYKGGSDEKATTSATVALMNEDEVNGYNIENGTNYVLLPSNCYSLDQISLNVYFGADDMYKEIPLMIDPNKFEAVPDRATKNYIIGMRLVSSPDSINSLKDIILIKPSIEDAKVYLGKVGYNANSVQISGAGDVVLSLPVNVSMKSNWDDLKVTLAVDPTLLGSYKALDASAYTLPTEVTIPKGKKSVTIDITVSRSVLAFGTFVIPIKIQSISKEFFKVDPATGTCLMGVTKFPAQIVLEASQLSIPDGVLAAGDGDGLPALLDGNTATYMHTAYGTPPPGDSKYGIYFDVQLAKPISMISFGFTTRASNGAGAPKEVFLYVSNDNVTWEKVGEVLSGLPTTGNTAFTSGVYERTTPFSYVRFCVMKSAAGVMDQDGAPCSFYNLSEFALFGL